MDINEVLDSLRVIKRICEESIMCDACPFRGGKNDDYICTIRNVEPMDWELAEEDEAWRAFKTKSYSEVKELVEMMTNAEKPIMIVGKKDD